MLLKAQFHIFIHLLYIKPMQITVNTLHVKWHFGHRFIGSCRASLASNAAPWSYTTSEAIKTSIMLKTKPLKKCFCYFQKCGKETERTGNWWCASSDIGLFLELLVNARHRENIFRIPLQDAWIHLFHWKTVDAELLELTSQLKR